METSYKSYWKYEQCRRISKGYYLLKNYAHNVSLRRLTVVLMKRILIIMWRFYSSFGGDGWHIIYAFVPHFFGA